MKIKVRDATPLQLDYLVAVIAGRNVARDPMSFGDGSYWIWEERALGYPQACYWRIGGGFSPTRLWEQGGPIIAKEGISISPSAAGIESWVADLPLKPTSFADKTRCSGDPLIAAMRCYVASKLGPDADVPKDLS